MRGDWRRGLIGGVVVCGMAVLGSGTAGATLSNFTAYKKTYPEAKNVSCKLCHTEAMGKGTNLNAYGKALQAFKAVGAAKALTAEDFQAFEVDDLDKDGATNQKELDAGTDPNDPASVPPATTSTP